MKSRFGISSSFLSVTPTIVLGVLTLIWCRTDLIFVDRRAGIEIDGQRNIRAGAHSLRMMGGDILAGSGALLR